MAIEMETTEGTVEDKPLVSKEEGGSPIAKAFGAGLGKAASVLTDTPPPSGVSDPGIISSGDKTPVPTFETTAIESTATPPAQIEGEVMNAKYNKKGSEYTPGKLVPSIAVPGENEYPEEEETLV